MHGALVDSPAMSKPDHERRLSPRVLDADVVQIEFLAPSSKVRDLSVSGLYLADPRPLQRGQPVELKLTLGAGEPIHIRGMVRRVDPGAGAAIEFIRIDAAGRRRIKEFITSSNPDKISPADQDELS